MLKTVSWNAVFGIFLSNFTPETEIIVEGRFDLKIVRVTITIAVIFNCFSMQGLKS